MWSGAVPREGGGGGEGGHEYKLKFLHASLSCCKKKIIKNFSLLNA